MRTGEDFGARIQAEERQVGADASGSPGRHGIPCEPEDREGSAADFAQPVPPGHPGEAAGQPSPSADADRRGSGPGPAAASLSPAEAWEHAVRWVDENRGLVVRNAEKRYAGFAPYDREDYVQQAYVAAFQAWTDCVRAGTPERFVAHLFLRFRRECRDEMGILREAPSSLQPGDRELPADRSSFAYRPRSPVTPEERAEAERRQELLWKALRWMTPKQQVAWLLALGHLGHGEADAREIARTLKISRRAAYGLLTRGQEQAEAAARREKERIQQENPP